MLLIVLVVVLAAECAGREHPLYRRRHLADRGPGHEQYAEEHADEQQRCGDPLRQPVRQRSADGETEEPGGMLARGRILRRTRPQVPQPQSGQRDHRRAKDQPGPGFGVGLGAHQHHGDRGEQDRQQHHRRADQDAQQGVDPLADGPSRVEPGACGDHDRDAEESQRDAVAAVTGLQVAGPPDRARRGSGALGQHQPAGADAAPHVRARGRDAGGLTVCSWLPPGRRRPRGTGSAPRTGL